MAPILKAAALQAAARGCVQRAMACRAPDGALELALARGQHAKKQGFSSNFLVPQVATVTHAGPAGPQGPMPWITGQQGVNADR